MVYLSEEGFSMWADGRTRATTCISNGSDMSGTNHNNTMAVSFLPELNRAEVIVFGSHHSRLTALPAFRLGGALARVRPL